jgi:hypothetical protein
MLAATLAGCRSVPPPDAGFGLAGTRLAIDDVRADRVLRDYLALAGARSALRGAARVVLEGPDFKLNRPQRIVVERPARLRFEVIGLFDQLAALLATDGRSFGFYDASSATIARGRVTPGLLWDLARVDLGVHEAVALLLAAPVPSDGVARAAVWLDAEGGIALVFGWPEQEPDPSCRDAARSALLDAACFLPRASLADGGEVYRFDAKGRLAEVRDVEPGGALRFRASFEDYGPIEGETGAFDFPHRVTVRSPRTRALARFDWKRVALAPALSDRLFRIPERRAAAGPG